MVLDEESMNQQFACYKQYLYDSKNSFQGGNVADLHTVLEALAPHTNPNTLPLEQLTTKEALLPLLMSCVSFQLAEKAVAAYMENPLAAFFQKQQGEEQDSSSNSNNNSSNSVEQHTGQCLTYFSQHAAAWVLGANFARITKRLHAAQIAVWYEQAAEAAVAVRTAALRLLESHSNDGGDDPQCENSYTEWVEVLLLNGVAGVERLALLDSSGEVCDASNSNMKTEQQEDEDEEGGSKNNSRTSSGMSASAEDGIWSSSTVEATARFMCAMLPSIAGDHATALISLRRFPVTHRLSNAMWTGENETAHQVSENGTTSPTTSLLLNKSEPSRYLREGGLLPSTLYQSLCQIFGRDAAYWKESNYAKRGYFSFFCDLPPKDAHPSNLVEDVVVNYLLPLAKRQLSIDEAEQICGYEWWVVSKQSDDDLGSNLHFEHDYALKDLYQKEIRPFLSSILYLEGHKKGSGASVVLDQTPDSTEDAEYGWRLSPTDNSLLVFPGDLMRGTMPNHSKHSSKPPVEAQSAASTDEAAGEGDDKPPTIVKKIPSDRMEEDVRHVNKLPSALLTTITKRQLLNVADLWQVQREEPIVKTGREDDGPGHTLSFLAAFWGHRVPDSLEKNNSDSYQPYTPAGPLPPNTAEHTWVHDIHVGYELPSSSMTSPAMQQPQTIKGNISKKRRQMAATHLENVKGSKLRRIGPAWEAVNDGDEDNTITDDGCTSVASMTSSKEQPYLQIPAGFSNRFFLQSGGETGSIASAAGRDDGMSSIQTTDSNR